MDMAEVRKDSCRRDHLVACLIKNLLSHLGVKIRDARHAHSRIADIFEHIVNTVGRNKIAQRPVIRPDIDEQIVRR